MAYSRGNGTLTDQLKGVRDEAMSVRGEASSIVTDLQQLMRMEVELAKSEMKEAQSHAMKGAAFGAIALELAMIMTLFLFLAVMFALDTAMPLWAAALITTGIIALLAGILGFLAKSQISKFSPTPKRAIRTMQEDIQWARSLMRSSRT